MCNTVVLISASESLLGSTCKHLQLLSAKLGPRLWFWLSRNLIGILRHDVMTSWRYDIMVVRWLLYFVQVFIWIWDLSFLIKTLSMASVSRTWIQLLKFVVRSDNYHRKLWFLANEADALSLLNNIGLSSRERDKRNYAAVVFRQNYR